MQNLNFTETAARAEKMTIAQLTYAYRDCVETAEALGNAEMIGKDASYYHDEASVYHAELRRRASNHGGTVDQDLIDQRAELLELGVLRGTKRLDHGAILNRRFQLVTDKLNMPVEVVGAASDAVVKIRPVFAHNALHCPAAVRFEQLIEIVD